jgi:hypothetical protein
VTGRSGSSVTVIAGVDMPSVTSFLAGRARCIACANGRSGSGVGD